ncbi:uncharacterized protein LOC123679652 isoform X2 [Harmonia axyridis]|uniref:uncharacterized protein LOC123679652 isoform X2 n=1 Tax=Harmonia axyridis TaxID=115357 RepID=UPI001E275894|nr:uncharacterized protein LOC123679652 isoform X2 [Harmonia axyridis]
MEAMAFQQKCRQQCQGFTYDKQVGTGDKIIFPKCNTCCCGVQSVSLCADQKEQLFHRIDECDTRSKLKICTCDPVETRRCTCFPKPNPNKYGSAKNLVIGERKERCCRDYDIVDQATREADAEAYLCCDCLDMWKKKNEKRRPSCLKKKCECCDEKRNASDELSFSFCGKTLEITEEKTTTLKSLKQPTKQLEIEDISSTIGPPSSQNDNADVVKYINEMKMKRKGIVKMAQSFRTTAKDYIKQLDRDIDHFRELYKVANVAKLGKENYIDTYNLSYLFDNSEFEKKEELTHGKYTSKTTPKTNVPSYHKKKNESRRQINDEEKIIKVIPPVSEENSLKRTNEAKSTTIESGVKSPDIKKINDNTINDKGALNTDQRSDKIDPSVKNNDIQYIAVINKKEEINTQEVSQPISKVIPDEEPAQTTHLSESDIPVMKSITETKELVENMELEAKVNSTSVNIDNKINSDKLNIQEDAGADEKVVVKPEELAKKNFEIGEKTSKSVEQNCTQICYQEKKDDKSEGIREYNDTATESVNQLNKSSNDEMTQAGQKSNKVQTSPELDSESKFIQTNIKPQHLKMQEKE